MCGTGVDEYCITGTGIKSSPVTGKNLYMAQVTQVALGTGGEVGINLDRSDMTFPSNDFSHDCRIVACAAANMDDMLSCLEIKRVNQEC
jgi:hypothetical protein